MALRDGLGAERVIEALASSDDSGLRRLGDRYRACLESAIVVAPVSRASRTAYVPIACDGRLCDHTVCHLHRTQAQRERWRAILQSERYDPDAERRTAVGIQRGCWVPRYPTLERGGPSGWRVADGPRRGRPARDAEFLRFVTLTLPRRRWGDVDRYAGRELEDVGDAPGRHARRAAQAAGAALRRLTRSPAWLHYCGGETGALARLELETDVESCNYNPHWHCVIGGGRYWPTSCQRRAVQARDPIPEVEPSRRWCQERYGPDRWCLSCTWHHVTEGDAYVVDVRRADRAVDVEVLKYVTKPLTIPDEDTIRDLVAGLRRQRTVRWLGTWYGSHWLEERDRPVRVRVRPGALADHAHRGGWEEYSCRARPSDFSDVEIVGLQVNWPCGVTHGPWRPGELPPRDPCRVVLGAEWAREAYQAAERQREAYERPPPTAREAQAQAVLDYLHALRGRAERAGLPF